MRTNRWTVVLVVMLAASWVALWQGLRWRAARVRVARLARQATDVGDRLAALRVAMQRRTSQLEALRGRNAADAARLGREGLAEQLAAAAEVWNTPPVRLPDWNPGSPFVWVNKTSLPSLHVKVFEEDGTMAPEFAAVIGLAPADQRRIHDALAQTLESFHAQERARAVVEGGPRAQAVKEAPESLTLRIPADADEGAPFRSRALAALLTELGEDRGRVVAQAAEGWLASSFDSGSTEPRTISVRRLPDGTFAVNVESPSSKMSVSGADSAEIYIPPYLRSLFDPLLGPAGRSVAPPP
jgi:hypothetical protein